MFNNRFFMPLVEAYHPNYRAVLQRASTLGYTLPSLPVSRVLNKFMVDLVNSGNFTELDCLWVYSNDGSQEFSTLNWVNPSVNQNVLVNSPTWTPNVGFESNGTTSYIDSSFNPNTQGVKYTLNSASIGIFVKDPGVMIAGSYVLAGLVQGTNHIFHGRNSNNNGRLAVRLNSDQSDAQFSLLPIQFSSNTLYSGVRTDSSTMTTYLSGGLSLTTPVGSTSIPNGNVYILARNNVGTSPSLYMVNGTRISVVFFGSENVNHLTMYNAINDLITNL